MRATVYGMMILVLAASLAGCGGEDPDVRRGNTFFENKKYDAAFKAFEQAYQRKPVLFDESPELRERFKNSYYYHGGQLELAGSLEAAVKYYEKGFELIPTDAGMANKLAQFFWEQDDFEGAAKYYEHLTEIDAQAPDTDKKWAVLAEDYYALGYALHQLGEYDEAIEAFQQSLKAQPKGPFAKKCKSAIEGSKYEKNKKKK